MLENTISQLLDEIDKLPGDSLLEKILSYCEENDIDPKEIGDMLSDSEQFKRILWIDAVGNNQIKDELLKNKLKETKDLEAW